MHIQSVLFQKKKKIVNPGPKIHLEGGMIFFENVTKCIGNVMMAICTFFVCLGDGWGVVVSEEMEGL